MDSYHTYPKVWAVGHPHIAELFEDEVLMEEKIDGSQFSFGKFNGELKCRSKGQEIIVDAPEKMFDKAVKTVLNSKDKLHDGWTYRAEYLSKPKHNTLAYDRVPVNNLIIFDINTDLETYLNYDDKSTETYRLGLEAVQRLGNQKLDNPDQVLKLLEQDSILGGQKIEGIVFKNYSRFGRDGKALMGKYVSEAFKEKHKVDWKTGNPSGRDFIALLAQSYRTPARWEKAVIHLKEKGLLENSPRDIGNLMKELQNDLDAECLEEIAMKMAKHVMPMIKRTIGRGFPEWYKEQLLKQQFDEGPDEWDI